MPKLIQALLARPYTLLIVIAWLLFTVGINSYSLRGSTEPREAGIAAEMLQDSQFVVPRLNGNVFLEKPPLSYWLQSAALYELGYQPLAVRLPSIAAGIACLCLIFFSVKKIGNDTALAWGSALLLLTMASFWMNARTAGQDILLALGVALALFSFNGARAASASWRLWLAYALGIAIATLTKGVVGLAIPGVVIFCFLLIETFGVDRRMVVSHWAKSALFAVVGLLPFALWLFLLYRQEGASALQQILWSNSVDRFSGDYQLGSHSEPFYYYLKKFPETFAPWNFLALFALWQLRHEILRNKNVLFFCCWLLAPYLLLSISSGKRPTYLLMIYPAASLLIVLFLKNTMKSIEKNISHNVIDRFAVFQCLLLTGAAVFTARSAWALHARVAAVVLGIILLPIIFLLWKNMLERKWRSGSGYAIAIMLVVYTGYGLAVLPRDTKQDSPADMFAKMRVLEREGYNVVLFKPLERFSGASSFYLQRSLPALNDPAQLQELFQKDQTAAALVADGDVAQLHDFHIIARFVDQKRKYVIISSAAAPDLSKRS